MKHPKRRVLVVSHDSSRTGAPLFLKGLLEQWQGSHWQCELWSVRPGPLDSLWPTVAPWAPHQSDLVRLNQLERITKRVKKVPLVGTIAHRCYRHALRRLSRQMKAQPYDLIYYNTLACSTALDVLKSHPAPKVAHIHELQSVAAHFQDSFQKTLAQSQSFIAVGSAVSRFLQSQGADPNSIYVTPVGVQWPPLSEAEIESQRQQTRQALGYQATDIVVLAVGTKEHRKGTDLFIQLAQEVFNRPSGQNIHFLWIGAPTHADYEAHLQSLQGAKANLKFLEPQSQIWPYMAACDLFCSPSREDPFPLVCIEAAGLAKPVLCFQNAGGIADFLTSQGGFSAPMGDVKALADGLSEAAHSPQKRAEQGTWAQKRVRRECDLYRIATNIQQTIDSRLW